MSERSYQAWLRRDDERRRNAGCLTYFITGRAGNCIMLPVWRWIGACIANLWKSGG